MQRVQLVISSIQKGLQLIGDEAKAQIKNNYMKNVIIHRGVQHPKVYQLANDQMKSELFKSLENDEKLKVAEELMKSEYGEDKLVSISIYEKNYKILTEADIDSIKKLIKEGYVQEWATCDILSRPIRKWTLLSEQNTRYIAEWSKEEECLWIRRCCCVSQVTRAKKGDQGNFQGYIDLLFEICERVIQYDQRFNQLGVGWLLRELYLADKKRTVSFIENHYNQLSREALRYAIRKMTAYQYNRLLDFNSQNKNEEIQKPIKK
ncbi:DNA alkylation repair enzyme (macronuclear) [Tetrahymena thermophila SB210]|uniref:DNA alkylation repair enzyme n=1 Tax=Tetrahymena thermophila (strain SB210) TaxID=312017 RepID=I7MK39_TETTS|nr:DNA alkylation repair enzyme [Tetrahymena thermophila SB210]EAR97510.2 DNA alkylation repair enzyme [Tetrahymena thermophila SB210]|eukprot:XP_001017755.2 DNA alkylation repair enzyme [Tetrahymena thermophila SB210]